MTRRFARGRLPAVVLVAIVAAGSAFVGWRLFARGERTDSSASHLKAASEELRSAYNTAVNPADLARPHSISAAQAIRAGAREARFLGGESPSAHLVNVSQIVPRSKPRLAWLVLIRHGEQPLLYGEEGSPAVTGPTTAAAFVDANSGKLIEIVTLSDP